ncbi:hypothetical protein MPH_04821 [Macrophomina phaseolina MS6]|uniref:Uncharacterized protein n=1 Tax=Macrophomina phaseolina (strain MS6) TaxID=1126212 RepID=K2S604_MACPH|nr:hypothetical protein MPH_04821 [Macrophomina phaseolina MS6]
MLLSQQTYMAMHLSGAVARSGFILNIYPGTLSHMRTAAISHIISPVFCACASWHQTAEHRFSATFGAPDWLPRTLPQVPNRALFTTKIGNPSTSSTTQTAHQHTYVVLASVSFDQPESLPPRQWTRASFISQDPPQRGIIAFGGLSECKDAQKCLR